MTVVRLRELANLVQAGDIEGLAFVTSKCHLRYKDIRVDGMPLLHLAVSSNELDMVKYLISQDVDICAVDKVSTPVIIVDNISLPCLEQYHTCHYS